MSRRPSPAEPDAQTSPVLIVDSVRVRKRRHLVLGLVLGAATTAAYLIGSGRVFGYDAAVTFENFIATPSLVDAFAVSTQQPTIPLAQIAGNDHVLISLISHVIYSLTGSKSEVVYRVLPALAAGGTVAAVAAALAARFGLLAGAGAGLYIATNPMFVENSRDVRGYSLATVCAVLATLLFLSFPPPDKGRVGRWRLALYGALLGLAIAAHAYAGLVLVAHFLWVVVRRSWPEFRRLVPAWALAAAIALAANGYILWVDATQGGFLPKLFDPAYPRDLVFYLLGAPALVAVGLWLSTAGLGLWALRGNRLMWTSVVLVAAVVLLLWLVVQPVYLYPRFFVFLVPGCALLIAAAIKRWKVLGPVVMVGAAVAGASQVADYTTDPLALRQAAQLVAQTEAAGQRTCVIHSDEQAFGAYAGGFTVVSSPDQLQGCDLVVVVSWAVDIPLRDEAAREFPRRTVLPAYYPTVVLER
jgi:hypothetical protein